jgi:putative flippase GtrA
VSVHDNASARGITRIRELLSSLRSPESGAIGQLARYGLAGGLVTLVYIAVTTLLAQVVRIPFEVALAIGFVVAVLLHFTLQRFFVWRTRAGFGLAMHHQVVRYLTMMGAQYACTAASSAVLPGWLGLSTEVVYVATVAVMAVCGFVVMRYVIFHERSWSIR